MTGMWDESRPVVGCHAAFLEFEDGTAATAVYSGYDHFNSRELTFGVGEARPAAEASVYAQGRKTLRQLANGDAETALKRAQRYGGRASGRCAPRRSASWVLGGPLIVTFEHGDVRLTPGGLRIYGDEDTRDIPISTETDGRHGIVDQTVRGCGQWPPAVSRRSMGQGDAGSLAGGVRIGAGTPGGLLIAPGAVRTKPLCRPSHRSASYLPLSPDELGTQVRRKENR